MVNPRRIEVARCGSLRKANIQKTKQAQKNRNLSFSDFMLLIPLWIVGMCEACVTLGGSAYIGGNGSSKISAQSPAVMRWQNYTRSLVSKRLLIVFSQLRPFGTSQKRGADPRLNSPPSPNQTQCAELRNQLTCLAFPFTPSFRRNHVELLRWRTI